MNKTNVFVGCGERRCVYCAERWKLEKRLEFRGKGEIMLKLTQI